MWPVVKDIIVINRGSKKRIPGLLFIFMVIPALSMAAPKQQDNPADTIPPELFTVAAIAAPAGNTTYYEVTFFQSARFYKLMRNNKNCAGILKLLKRSKKNNQPIQVFLTQRFGDIIDNVKR